MFPLFTITTLTQLRRKRRKSFEKKFMQQNDKRIKDEKKNSVELIVKV